jgi:hypothetical protein
MPWRRQSRPASAWSRRVPAVVEIRGRSILPHGLVEEVIEIGRVDADPGGDRLVLEMAVAAFGLVEAGNEHRPRAGKWNGVLSVGRQCGQQLRRTDEQGFHYDLSPGSRSNAMHHCVSPTPRSAPLTGLGQCDPDSDLVLPKLQDHGVARRIGAFDKPITSPRSLVMSVVELIIGQGKAARWLPHLRAKVTGVAVCSSGGLDPKSFARAVSVRSRVSEARIGGAQAQRQSAVARYRRAIQPHHRHLQQPPLDHRGYGGEARALLWQQRSSGSACRASMTSLWLSARKAPKSPSK